MQAQDVHHPRVRAVGHRRPLGPAVGSGEHPHAGGCRLREHVLLGDEGLGLPDQLAGRAVVDVEPAGLSRMADGLHALAVRHRLEQHGRADRVEVPDVVGHVLVVPLVFPRRDVQRDHGLGVEVVARPDLAIEVG